MDIHFNLIQELTDFALPNADRYSSGVLSEVYHAAISHSQRQSSWRSPSSSYRPLQTRRQPQRIAAEQETEVQETVTPEDSTNNSKAAQLLGIRGASQEDNIWKIRLQLTKPVTWVPLIWGVVCGAAASGRFEWNFEDVAKSIFTMILAAPLLTGYTQTMNDWFDREIDAINEPYRPIPSGAISETDVIVQIWVLLLSGLGSAYVLDRWSEHTFPVVTSIAIFGALVSYIYSAPPIKLKQYGWLGNYALGSSYISFPWWAGQAVFGNLTLDVMLFTVLYSIAGLGIAIVNDFKSIEGDRELGLQSLPVAFGMEKAKWICVASIDVTQLCVASYVYFGLEEKTNALILLGFILPQIFFQFKYFLPDPVKNDVRYQASAQPFFVFGLLTTAIAFGHRTMMM